LLSHLFAYFSVTPQEFDHLKPLEDEICHFRHIKVFLKDIRSLQRDIECVRRYPEREKLEAELRQKFEARQLSFDDLLAQTRELQAVVREKRVEYRTSPLSIRYLPNHYYVPVILSYDEKVDYIRHIIRHESEVKFLNDLDDYLQYPGNHLEKFDWWLFSKLDESLDQVYIPYYDPHTNKIRRFNPDFIFWLQKGGSYYIVFVDPKGMQQTGYQHKIDGYKQLFLEEAGTPRLFLQNGLKVQVLLLLYTDDANKAPQEYREFWIDHPEAIADLLKVSPE